MTLFGRPSTVAVSGVACIPNVKVGLRLKQRSQLRPPPRRPRENQSQDGRTDGRREIAPIYRRRRRDRDCHHRRSFLTLFRVRTVKTSSYNINSYLREITREIGYKVTALKLVWLSSSHFMALKGHFKLNFCRLRQKSAYKSIFLLKKWQIYIWCLLYNPLQAPRSRRLTFFWQKFFQQVYQIRPCPPELRPVCRGPWSNALE